jgi:ABC-2 type transport system permease protein
MRLRVLLAMIRRDWLITRSYRIAFVLDFLFSLLNLVAFFFISETFEGVRTGSFGAAPNYFAFAAVGMSMTLVIQSATVGMSGKVREEQLTGTLEMLAAHPVSPTEISLGLAGFPFVFAIFRAALYMLVAGAFLGLDLSNASWVGFALVLLGAGAALSSIGIVLGAVMLSLKRGEGVAGLAVFSLSLLGGALFPIDVLPGWLQAIGRVVPTRFAFDGIRSALFSGSGWFDDLTVLCAFAVVGVPVALYLFGVALRHATKTGSLGQY